MVRILPSSPAPWLLWSVGLMCAFYPALLSGFARLQINPGDPRLVNYILEHSYLWLVGAANHQDFWSPPVFFPATQISAYSDVMLAAGPLYWVWRAAGVEPGYAFQLWMMACLSLNYLTAYLFLVKGLRVTAWPAAVGAFLVAFGAAKLANFNSPQLFPVFYSMLALLAAARVVDACGDGRPRAAVLWIFTFFTAFALQAWSAFYAAFFSSLLALLALGIALVLPRSRATVTQIVWRHPVAIAGGAALGALLIAPLAFAYLQVADVVGLRLYESVARALPTWLSWVYTGRNSVIYEGINSRPYFDFATAQGQHTNGVGFLTSALCLVGLVRERARPLVGVVLGTMVVAIVLSTRLWGEVALWKIVYDFVPGAGGIRYVARVGQFLVIPAAIGMAYFLSEWRGGWKRVAAALLAVFCMAEQLQGLSGAPEGRFHGVVQRIGAEVDPNSHAFLLVTEADPSTTRGRGRPRLTQIVAMWVGLQTGVPTVNGFYGNQPPDWGLGNVDHVTEGDRDRIGREFERWIRDRHLDPTRLQLLMVPVEWVDRAR